MEAVVDYLRRRLREAGAASWERIAIEAGVSRRLPAKIAYGERRNPRLDTVQPLLDFFAAVDRGERALPPPAHRQPARVDAAGAEAPL